MKGQFPLVRLCLCALGAVGVVPNVWWRLSGEEKYPVIPGERLTAYGEASCQRRAGFPVDARLCVADDDVVGVDVMRVQ